MVREKLGIRCLVRELTGGDGTRADLLAMGITDQEIERLRRLKPTGRRGMALSWLVGLKIEAAKHSNGAVTYGSQEGDGDDNEWASLYY